MLLRRMGYVRNYTARDPMLRNANTSLQKQILSIKILNVISINMLLRRMGYVHIFLARDPIGILIQAFGPHHIQYLFKLI